MYAHFSGKIIHKSPTMVVVDCNGVGYELHISLHTYEKLKDEDETFLFAYLAVKEDAHTLYGFADETERFLFRHLISVNGIGAATARMLLSSLSTDEAQHAIISGNVSLLKSVKGVGPKSAQRIILELQDKLQKIGTGDSLGIAKDSSGAAREEAISALLMLGFAKAGVEKAVNVVMDQNKSAPLKVEEIIKLTLKRL